MKGRKPKPREIAMAEGAHIKNPQRYRNTPPPTASQEPQIPEHFQGVAKEEWEAMEALMRPAGMWSATYSATVEMYCEATARYHEARAKVEELGLAIETESGVKRNPFAVELHKAKEQRMKLLVELGMTPSSRGRVSAKPEDKGDDPLLGLVV